MNTPRLSFVWVELENSSSSRANGVALKLKFPYVAAYVDKEGLRRDDLSKFIVIVACGINLSHFVVGNFVSHRYNPVIK